MGIEGRSSLACVRSALAKSPLLRADNFSSVISAGTASSQASWTYPQEGSRGSGAHGTCFSKGPWPLLLDTTGKSRTPAQRPQKRRVSESRSLRTPFEELLTRK